MDQRTRRTLWLLAGAAVVVALVAHHNITKQEIILFCVIVPSIILHEVSHGWVARAFGDDTAARAGRLSLNPVVHVDPVGTLLVPAMLALGGFGVIGWAKPVPVNNARLRSPRNQGLLVSLAGPAVNALLAGIFAVIFVQGILPGLRTQAALHGGVPLSTVDLVVFFASLVNVGLFVFNMLPIPPLDGSALFERLLPARYWPTYLRYRQYTMFILMGLVLLNFLLNPGPLTVAFQHLQNWWAGVLGLGGG
jgi:Zn-dependent protease